MNTVSDPYRNYIFTGPLLYSQSWRSPFFATSPDGRGICEKLWEGGTHRGAKAVGGNPIVDKRGKRLEPIFCGSPSSSWKLVWGRRRYQLSSAAVRATKDWILLFPPPAAPITHSVQMWCPFAWGKKLQPPRHLTLSIRWHCWNGIRLWVPVKENPWKGPYLA